MPRLILAIILLATGSPVVWACSVCGCSLSADWGLTGHADTIGSFTSVRYEFFDQTDLRHGHGSVDRSTLVFPSENEIQRYTTNRNVWFQYDQVINAHWSLSVQLPYYQRDHATIAEGDVAESYSHARGFGDMKLLFRHRWRKSFNSSWEVQAGLKLPSGRIDQTFAAGPQAGEPLDRGLQLGTGTTDLLLGASWYGRPSLHLAVFAQAQADQPLAQREGFAPSPGLTMAGGARWLNTSDLTPELQINVNCFGREAGPEGDIDNSGGTQVYASPGLVADLSRSVSAFAFVQLPFYQHLNGLQLQPHWLLTTGAHWRW